MSAPPLFTTRVARKVQTYPHLRLAQAVQRNGVHLEAIANRPKQKSMPMGHIDSYSVYGLSEHFTGASHNHYS